MALGKPGNSVGVEKINSGFDLHINVRGPIVTTKAALAHLKEGGRAVTIGSYLADPIPFGAFSIYSASKLSLSAFNRGLVREHGPKGITSKIVQAGSIDTDMNPAHGPFG